MVVCVCHFFCKTAVTDAHPNMIKKILNGNNEALPPILVVHGRGDRVVPAQVSKVFMGLLSDFRDVCAQIVHNKHDEIDNFQLNRTKQRAPDYFLDVRRGHILLMICHAI